MGSHAEDRMTGLPGHGGNGRPSLLGDLLGRGLLWIAVKKIRNLKTVYVGKSLQKASQALTPGTCYAVGESEYDAEREASREVNRFHHQEK